MTAAVETGKVITALDDPINYNVKHPLQKRWTLWYDCPDKKSSSQNWDEQLKNLITVDTVEDFWGVFNNVWKPTQLTLGANYHFFKEGVKPAWEDPENAAGGKWNLQIPKSNRGRLDEMWLNTALSLIGEMMEDSNEITGAVVSVRRGQDRIAIWTKTISEDICLRIGKFWKKVLSGDDAVEKGKGEKIGFVSHESQKSNAKGKVSELKQDIS